MKKSMLFVLIPVLAVLAVLLVMKKRSEAEPQYGGKKWSEWLSQLTNISPQARDEGKKAFVQMGEAGLKPLALMAGAVETQAYEKKLPKYIPLDEISVLRMRAVQGFKNLGPDGKAGIPFLVEVLGEKESYVQVGTCLGCLGPEGQQALVTALSHSTQFGRASGAVGLGTMGPAAEGAVGDLAKALKDSDPLVRYRSAQALMLIAKKPEIALEPLAAALGDTDSGVQEYAAAALGAYGPEAKPVLPAMLEALKKAEGVPARSLRGAIAKVDPTAGKRVNPEGAP